MKRRGVQLVQYRKYSSSDGSVGPFVDWAFAIIVAAALGSLGCDDSTSGTPRAGSLDAAAAADVAIDRLAVDATSVVPAGTCVLAASNYDTSCTYLLSGIPLCGSILLS